jgi:UDP-N-acetylmuramyl pentapeptide phosphotransferase/UDP-N-acetylglucosamine-1-phosphate transferase
MSVLLGFVVGLLMVRLLVVAGHELMRVPVLERSNHRGRVVTNGIGVLAVFSVVLVEAGRSLFSAFGVGDAPTASARLLVLMACIGFGFLGLFDDAFGSQSDSGFRGHLGALARGRVTTGTVKIVGGCALAVVVVRASPVGSGAGISGIRVVADALVVALGANLSNLFDRAPGRAIKIGLLAWAPIALLARTDMVGVAIAPVMGAFAGLFVDDLRERLMIGDAGSNVIGAVLGLAVVLECSSLTRTIVLVVLFAFTLTSEFVSFSRVIDRVTVLRTLDRLGRRA